MNEQNTNTQQALEKLLPLFNDYYTLNKNPQNSIFDATAVFSSHNEQYFLIKSAKIADIDSNEYVYFATSQNLSLEQLQEFDAKAWEQGLSNVVPKEGHRNSDVLLIIICQTLEKKAKKAIKKCKHSKTYKLGMWGWSNYKLAVADLSTKSIITNRLGKDLIKIVNNILK